MVRRNRRSQWRYNQIAHANISRREIVALYEKGYGQITISERLHLDCYGIVFALNAEGYSRPRNNDLQRVINNTFTQRSKAKAHEKNMRILRMYQSGMSIGEIALREGVSKQRIHARLQAVGYKRRPVGTIVHTF